MPVIRLANGLIDQEALGRGLKFPLTVDLQTNEFKTVAYEENVKECIFWLLATNVGERVMAEDIGTTYGEALFADIEDMMELLPPQTVEAIELNEPRVGDVGCRADRTGPTTLRLTVTWYILATGRKGNLVYPYSTEPTAGGISQ